jgi:hypothetical protein
MHETFFINGYIKDNLYISHIITNVKTYNSKNTLSDLYNKLISLKLMNNKSRLIVLELTTDFEHEEILVICKENEIKEKINILTDFIHPPNNISITIEYSIEKNRFKIYLEKSNSYFTSLFYAVLELNPNISINFIRLK